ncbi:DUF3558 family protein [Nocardia carnea]|uniref:DUF3558 family protein n=1 Tax=Nocardia carnea TaxID=37328 RepID=UPI002453C563|nr:DUF3558 family protein [Nocardia carnea]
MRRCATLSCVTVQDVPPDIDTPEGTQLHELLQSLPVAAQGDPIGKGGAPPLRSAGDVVAASIRPVAFTLERSRAGFTRPAARLNKLGGRGGSRSLRGIAVVGAVVVGCCSCGGTTEPQYPSGYSALPASCAEVGTAAGDTLHRFAGDLPIVDARLVTTSEFDTGVGQTLTCTVTYEDPIPHLDRVSTPEPLSRTARIDLLVWTNPAVLGQTTTSAETEPTSASEAPTPIRGLGDQADIRTLPIGKNQVAVGVRTMLGNLAVNVHTQGLNWSGESGTPPTGDSPVLRNDLASGAESIAAALVDNLSVSLSRTTFPPESATASVGSTTSTLTTPTAPQPMWDPCTIPDADVAAAGLNPQSEKTGTPKPEVAQCRWTGPSHDVAVFTRNRRYTDWAYGVFTQPRPVMVGDRRALLAVPGDVAANASCTLLFDIPQGTQDGIETGVVEVQASTETPGNRDALCADLIRLAVPLTQHLPAGR